MSSLETYDAFLNKSLNDRDDVSFNFEVDYKKMVKKLELDKIINGSIQYKNRVKKYMKRFLLDHYLKDMIAVGNKKFNRFKRDFKEPVNGI